MSKILKLLAVLLVAGSLLSPAALAKNENARDSLVALGDSIPFGYNLGVNNQHPSKAGYPSIIGEEADLRVRNLAVPGEQTEGLLSDLQTSQKYRQVVKHADYVTLSIINNDLLEILREAGVESAKNPDSFQQLVLQKLLTDDAFLNLNAIITEIRELTDAPIVLYNVYNPYQTGDPLYGTADLLLTGIPGTFPGVNPALAASVSGFDDIYIVDAYSAFDGNQAEYVIMGDIHPTVAGQEVLADLALGALKLE
ncbi:GDSL-type esterase/lipase family protein [Planococcus lenghuensis]|uniref:Lipolytic protein G-D-S-L family n=1 Tax=Planococcus lenghuensis TaxID=2213202 RepID=A0A1Q2KVN4_9BACL|nr:GDSL-type esterase/lipase family protein [Planococcus lenghuensis]AQQ52176.1 lipolytic protein G-D-S-L family [Planococcus lenghuensis]